MSTKNKDVKPATKKVAASKIKEITPLSAYSDGYMSAILRKPILKCPHTKETLIKSSWARGYAKGGEVVTYHTRNLKPKSYFARTEEW